MLFKTIDQKPAGDDFAEARELIEIRGTDTLTLQDRRIINMLYANAGARLSDDVRHVIGMAELRGNHKGGERVKDPVLRLMKTIVTVPDFDQRGSSAGQNVQILSTTTITDDDDDPFGQVIYEFSPAMRAIIRDSTLLGPRAQRGGLCLHVEVLARAVRADHAKDQPEAEVAGGIFDRGSAGTARCAGEEASAHQELKQRKVGRMARLQAQAETKSLTSSTSAA